MTLAALDAVRQGVDPRLLHEVQEEVSAVEAELRRRVRSHADWVDRVGRSTLEAGGKRLRPALVALAAKAAGAEDATGRATVLGAVMEMIHMATLIHDDVVDEASLRRGRPTAAALVGNTAAILTGDVLLAKAMVALAEDGDLEIIRTVSQAVVEMAEGEVREIQARSDFDLEEGEFMDIVGAKTAGFIRCCCEAGALLAGADEARRQALAKYGHHLGLAFQIVDDLLDYRGDRRQTGKAIGTDFRDGQATLPLIHLRPQLSDAEGRIARGRFGSGASDDEVRMIADWMATRGAFERSERAARRHADLALESLSILPESRARLLLETVAEYVLGRAQ